MNLPEPKFFATHAGRQVYVWKSYAPDYDRTLSLEEFLAAKPNATMWVCHLDYARNLYHSNQRMLGWYSFEVRKRNIKLQLPPVFGVTFK